MARAGLFRLLSPNVRGVPHRHAVLILPDRLREVLEENRELWKVVMDSAIKALNETLSHSSRREVVAGAIIVLHPFGRNLRFNPHIHLLITEVDLTVRRSSSTRSTFRSKRYDARGSIKF
jgi:hypothetical protein